MITHIVLLRPRPDLTHDEQRALIDALKRAFREIPTIRRVRAGVRVTHDASYEQLAKDDLTIAATIEFDDLAGLQAYLEHPAHQELGARFRSSAEIAWVYDYEMGAVDGLDALLGRIPS